MTIKHTPGPWSLDTLTGTVIGANVRGYGASVANVYGPDGEAWDAETETRANAYVIVEAPTMVAALREMEASFTADNSYALHRAVCRAILARIDGEA
jgi:hypothetical protein